MMNMRPFNIDDDINEIYMLDIDINCKMSLQFLVKIVKA